jgi:hypothetical protein
VVDKPKGAAIVLVGVGHPLGSMSGPEGISPMQQHLLHGQHDDRTDDKKTCRGSTRTMSRPGNLSCSQRVMGRVDLRPHDPRAGSRGHVTKVGWARSLKSGLAGRKSRSGPLFNTPS